MTRWTDKTEAEIKRQSEEHRRRWNTPVPLPKSRPVVWGDPDKPAKAARVAQVGAGKRGRAELSLPWPPSVNHYWRRNKGPGMHISEAGKAFRSRVVALCAVVGGVSGRVAVQIIAYPPDRRARDLDNICKSLLDAIQHGGAIESDSMIDDLHITRSEIVIGGRVDVVVTAL